MRNDDDHEEEITQLRGQVRVMGAMLKALDLRCQELEDQIGQRRKGHLWIVPGLAAAVAIPFKADAKRRGVSSGLATAGALAVVAALALPNPPADDPTPRPPRVVLPEPGPPIGIRPPEGEGKEEKEPRQQDQEQDEGTTVPVDGPKLSDPAGGQPEPPDTEPPEEPPARAPMEPKQDCAVDLDLDLKAAKVSLSLCTPA